MQQHKAVFALSLCRKAGALVTGFDAVKESVYTGKAALVLDGRLCRGADNATGDLCCAQELGPAWPGLLHFLGISQLIVGYETEEFRNKVCESTKGFGGKAHYIRHSQDTYPVSMAAVTQREWFESIYFML